MNIKNLKLPISIMLFSIFIIGCEKENILNDNISVVEGKSAKLNSTSSKSYSGSLAYELLEGKMDIVTLPYGTYTTKYNAAEAQGRAWNAIDGVTFKIKDIQWGAVDINSGSSITDMVWAGGYFRSGRPWNASWEDHKATHLPNLPGRNSAAIENRSTGTIITGVYAFNTHDAFRSTSAVDWEVQHCWTSYTRDDAIENDGRQAGRVYHSIFDGVYTGISTRADDATINANGAVLTLRKVMLRLQAMPYPYDYANRPNNCVDSNNNPWVQGVSTGIPYGHGHMFKVLEAPNVSKNMHFNIKYCTFVAGTNMVNGSLLDFPDASLIDEMVGVTVVWLGTGDYPGYLPTSKFPNSNQLRVLKADDGTAALDHYWTQIRDWHDTHDDVEPGLSLTLLYIMIQLYGQRLFRINLNP